MDAAYLLQLDFTTILTTLKTVKNFDWFKHYLSEFFHTTLLLLDEIIFLQNGRIVQQHHQEAAQGSLYTHPTRKDYFNSDYAQGSGETKLTMLSIDGYHYFQKELANELKVLLWLLLSIENLFDADLN